MKILILANDDGGVYFFRRSLIAELIKNGHRVYVSTPITFYEDKLKKLGCYLLKTEVDRRGINPLRDFKLIVKYRKLLKEINPDKVLTYTIKPNIYGGFVCRNIDYYSNITGLGTAFQKKGMLKTFVVLLYKIGLKNAKKVFFENKECRDIFVKNNIVPLEKTHCLNGAGVDLNEFSYRKYPKDDLPIRFIFIGRIMREKGIDELIYAATKLKNLYKNVEIDVIGYFEDNYKELITELDSKKIINFYGYQEDVRPFIEHAHCFVLPSYHEGMANTLLESGAMGRPLITSNIHGCLEAVEDGRTGLLCNAMDADDLFDKMKKFIGLPYNEKKKMGELSHKYIAQKFDKRKVVEETISHILV